MSKRLGQASAVNNTKVRTWMSKVRSWLPITQTFRTVHPSDIFTCQMTRHVLFLYWALITTAFLPYLEGKHFPMCIIDGTAYGCGDTSFFHTAYVAQTRADFDLGFGNTPIPTETLTSLARLKSEMIKTIRSAATSEAAVTFPDNIKLELNQIVNASLSRSGVNRTLEAVAAGPKLTCHILGHFIGGSLISSVQDLRLGLGISGYFCQGGLLHSIVSMLVERQAHDMNIPLSQIMEALKQRIEPLAAELRRDYVEDNPLFPRNVLHSLIHGASHGIVNILGERMAMNSPEAQYSVCRIYTDAYVRHLCFFFVYHVFSHWNPSHFYPQDRADFVSSHALCAQANHSFAGCFRLRLRNQITVMMRKIDVQNWVDSCLPLPRSNRLGCIMSTGQLITLPNGPAVENLKKVTRMCDELAFDSSENARACVFGITSVITGLGDSIPYRLDINPCLLLRSEDLSSLCFQMLNPHLNVHWYDSTFLHDYSVRNNVDLKRAHEENAWIPTVPVPIEITFKINRE